MNLSLELSTSRGLQSRRFLPGRSILLSKIARQHKPFHRRHLRPNGWLNLVSKLAIQQTESISLSGSLTGTSPNDACFWYKPPQLTNIADFDLDILLKTSVRWLANEKVVAEDAQERLGFWNSLFLKRRFFTGSGFHPRQRVIHPSLCWLGL